MPSKPRIVQFEPGALLWDGARPSVPVDVPLFIANPRHPVSRGDASCWLVFQICSSNRKLARPAELFLTPVTPEVASSSLVGPAISLIRGTSSLGLPDTLTRGGPEAPRRSRGSLAQLARVAIHPARPPPQTTCCNVRLRTIDSSECPRPSPPRESAGVCSIRPIASLKSCSASSWS